MNLISHKTESINGEIICPGDKSISQRILIIGSLLNCDMQLDGFLNAEDPISTMEALNEIGASISIRQNYVFLNKREAPFKNPVNDLNLGNSGTGSRLLLGLISGLGIRCNLTGDKSLSKRPMNRIVEPLKKMGAEIKSNDGKLPIITLGSNITNNFEYKMPIASAQVKSSLLLAALASKNNIKIIESKNTRDHTERMIEFFGGGISYGDCLNQGVISLNNCELSSKKSYNIPGDFSSAAFVIVASIISKNSEVLIKNVGLNKTRNGLLKILLLMGADIKIKNKRLNSNEEVGDILVKSSNLKGIDVPEEIIPNIIDEIPILSIAASFAKGETTITNAAELRVKESDRLNGISEGLKKLQIVHQTFEDGISIKGTSKKIYSDSPIESFGDHRIAMSFLISGIRSKNSVSVLNCKNIDTSFPNFKNVMNSLGMKIDAKN